MRRRCGEKIAPCSSSFAMSASPAAGAPSSTRSTPRCRPAPPRSSARRGAASRRCCGCSTGWPTPTAARSPIGASRSRPRIPSCSGARYRSSRSCRHSSTGPSSRTSSTPPASPARTLTRAAVCDSPVSVPSSPAARSPGSRSASSSARCWRAPSPSEPDVLLLDEPTSALDRDARDAIEETLSGLREELGISLVLVTHDPEQAARMSDRTIRIEAGRVECEQLDPRRALAGRRVPGPGHDRGGDLALAGGRPRARHPGRDGPLDHPADPRRLRDQADLRRRLDLAGGGAAGGDGPVRGADGAEQGEERSRRFLAAADRPLDRGRDDTRPGRRPRHLRSDAAVPGPGRGDGHRQLDDGVGGGAQPARGRDERQPRPDRGDAGPRRDLPRSRPADREAGASLGDDHADRLDQDHRADLLPRDDGRDAPRRRQPDRCGAAAADPSLRAARQRRDRRAAGDLARLPELLHPGAAAARGSE